MVGPARLSHRLDAQKRHVVFEAVPGVAAETDHQCRKEVEGQALSYTFPRVVESFEFYLSGGDNRSETVRVEVRDRSDTGSSGKQPLPRLSSPYPERRDESDTGYDDPTTQTTPPRT